MKKKLRNLIRKQKQKSSQYQVFEDIEDLPIWNFKKVQAKSDLRYLFVLQDYNQLPTEGFNVQRLVKIWEKICDQYIDEFGFSEEQIMIYDKMLQITKMQCSRIIKQDKSLLTKINIHEKDLEILLGNTNKVKQVFEEQVMILTANLGIPINTRKMSVKEYYYLVKVYDSQIQKRNAEIQKSKKGKERS